MAVAILAFAAQLHAQPKVPSTQDVIGSAYRLRDIKAFDDAVRACERVVAMPGATAPQKQEAFEVLVDVYRRQKASDKALATAVRMGREVPDWAAAQVRSLVLQGDVSLDVGKKAEALGHYAAAAGRTDEARVKQACLYRIASIHQSENRDAEALAAFERVFTETPTVTDYWYESQRNIAELLRKAGRLAEAVQAARVCLDAAGDPGNVSGNTAWIATMLKEMDKDVARANAFIDFEQYGPAGKDAQAGTADDVANPLAAVGYAAVPQREAAFAKARAEAGDDFAASRLRALTYVYGGHPAEALKHFAEAFRRRSGQPYDMQPTVAELVAVGVRGVQGHPAGLKRFYDFVRLGPAGADAQAGTADDLKDPFAEVGLAARAAADDGGLVPPAAADRKALVELRGALETMAAAERDDHQLRQELLAGLARVHVALCDWGMKGQKDWYLRQLLEPPGNVYVFAALAWGGQAAARGSDLHFGGEREFWRELDAGLQADGVKWPNEVQQVRGASEQTLKLIEQLPPLTPKLQPMK